MGRKDDSVEGFRGTVAWLNDHMVSGSRHLLELAGQWERIRACRDAVLRELGREIDMEEVKGKMLIHFQELFQCAMIARENNMLPFV